jgi:hypothetical protein
VFRRLPALICAIAALSPTRVARSQVADEGAWKLSGYYLNLFTRSRTVVPPEEAFALDLNRIRLKLDARPLKRVGLDLEYDNEVLLGNYVRTRQFALTSARVETSFDLQREYARTEDVIARHAIYRASATWSTRNTDVRVGRQRIALGTGYFWSPMDLLNPIDPARLDRDYRTGADAMLVEQRLGALGRASAIYVPSARGMKAVGAGYLHGNVRGADYSVVLGTFRGDEVLGVDFSGSVGGLGLRGEATATRSDSDKGYGRVLVGADYGFASSLTVTVESYYNGQGSSDATRYDVGSFIAGRTLSLGRWYSALAASYQVTPLLKAAGYVLLNAGDGSAVVWPRLEWSVRSDIDLVLGFQRFAGGRASEYGRVHNLLYTEARWFF